MRLLLLQNTTVILIQNATKFCACNKILFSGNFKFSPVNFTDVYKTAFLKIALALMFLQQTEQWNAKHVQLANIFYQFPCS